MRTGEWLRVIRKINQPNGFGVRSIFSSKIRTKYSCRELSGSVVVIFHC